MLLQPDHLVPAAAARERGPAGVGQRRRGGGGAASVAHAGRCSPASSHHFNGVVIEWRRDVAYAREVRGRAVQRFGAFQV